MSYGEVKAYTQPVPGVTRPLRIVASPGVIPVVLTDADGVPVSVTYVMDQAVVDQLVTSRAAVETGPAQTLERIENLLKDLVTMAQEATGEEI